MAKRKGLGRGLDALLSTSAPSHEEASASGRLRDLPVDQVERGRYQPRTAMDEEGLEELARSIRARGIVQPILVRPLAGGQRYEIIAGERRWRAAQMAGLANVPAVVREVPDEAALGMALIENIQRQDLNPLDEAQALKRLTTEFGLTHQQVADAVGRSRAAVSNLLRLLDLEPEVRARLESGELDMGHGRALLGLPRPLQLEAAAEVVSRDLSARQTEALVRRLRQPPAAPAGPRKQDPDVRRLEGELSERLGTEVRVEAGRGGKGRLVIRYASLDVLDGILERIH
jgi:ParB family chromosome partitioning protein